MKLMQRSLPSLLFSLGLLAPASAQFSREGGLHAMLGGGYLEEPATGYIFGQLGWTPYEDAAFAHTFFLEGLFHSDDSQLDFIGPGGFVLFREDADLVFANITGNYQLEAKIAEPVSLYGGAGAGFELVSINDRFDESLDEDVNFLAQVFAGIRIEITQGLQITAGIRRIFREDFSLLGDQFITEDAWGYEFGIGFRF